MADLNDVRKQHQGKSSEAAQIYFDEGTRGLFAEIQKIRHERDLAIIEAIAKVNSEFDEKLKAAEENHAFVMVLKKD